MISVSGKFNPQAFTSTKTSFAFGFKSATSSKTKEDGGPYALHCIAFMNHDVLLSFPRRRESVES
jgi:hypothetical protein